MYVRIDVYNSETLISPYRIREIGRGDIRWGDGDGTEVSLCAGTDAAAAAVAAAAAAVAVAAPFFSPPRKGT